MGWAAAERCKKTGSRWAGRGRGGQRDKAAGQCAVQGFREPTRCNGAWTSPVPASPNHATSLARGEGCVAVTKYRIRPFIAVHPAVHLAVHPVTQVYPAQLAQFTPPRACNPEVVESSKLGSVDRPSSAVRSLPSLLLSLLPPEPALVTRQSRRNQNLQTGFMEGGVQAASRRISARKQAWSPRVRGGGEHSGRRLGQRTRVQFSCGQ